MRADTERQDVARLAIGATPAAELIGAIHHPGNVTPAAEANIANDPDAARIVLQAGWDVALVPLDVTMAELLTEQHRHRLLAGATATSRFAAGILRYYLDVYQRDVFGERAAACHDPLAAALAVSDVSPVLAPAVAVDVDTGNGPGRGMTIADTRGQYQDFPRRTPGYEWCCAATGRSPTGWSTGSPVSRPRPMTSPEGNDPAMRTHPPESGVDVVVIGSANIDLSARVREHPQPGQTVPASALTITAGGKGANQAVAAARLGASTAMVGRVGNDPHADTLLRSLNGDGVDTTYVTRDQHTPTGTALITVTDSGENSIVVAGGANARVSDADIDAARALLTSARVVSLVLEIPIDAVVAAAHAARGSARIVLNLSPVTDLLADVLALADPLIVNEHEAREVLRDHGISRNPVPTPPSRCVGSAPVRRW